MENFSDCVNCLIHSFIARKHYCVSDSVVSDSVTPWNVSRQAPLSMGFPRQEYWSGLSFPSPEDLPNSGIRPRSLAMQADSLPSEPPEKLIKCYYGKKKKSNLNFPIRQRLLLPRTGHQKPREDPPCAGEHGDHGSAGSSENPASPGHPKPQGSSVPS